MVVGIAEVVVVEVVVVVVLVVGCLGRSSG